MASSASSTTWTICQIPSASMPERRAPEYKMILPAAGMAPAPIQPCPVSSAATNSAPHRTNNNATLSVLLTDHQSTASPRSLTIVGGRYCRLENSPGQLAEPHEKDMHARPAKRMPFKDHNCQAPPAGMKQMIAVMKHMPQSTNQATVLSGSQPPGYWPSDLSQAFGFIDGVAADRILFYCPRMVDCRELPIDLIIYSDLLTPHNDILLVVHVWILCLDFPTGNSILEILHEIKH